MMGRIVDMYFGLNAVIFSTSKKYRIDLFFTLFLILGVYLANLWLIPIFGMVGAAISTSAAYLLYNIFRGYYIYSAYDLNPYTKSQLYLIVNALVVFIFFTLLNNLVISPLSIQPFISFVVKEILLFIVLILPIYFWKLEPESVAYFDQILNKWFKK